MRSNVHEVALRRRSVRAFENRPVPDEMVETLLEAAANAPSGGNIQPLSIILVRDAAKRGRLAEMVGRQPWVRSAPLSMIFCIDFRRSKRWAELFGVDFRLERSLSSFLIAYADLVCAAENVVLVAEDLGLGSVYIGTIMGAIDEAREMLAIPEYVVPMLLLSVGYPKRVPKTVPKLPPDVIAHDERYRDPTDAEVKVIYEAKYGAMDEDFEEYVKKSYVELVEAELQGEKTWPKLARARARRLQVASNAQFLFELRYPSDGLLRASRRLVESLDRAGFPVTAGGEDPDEDRG